MSRLKIFRYSVLLLGFLLISLPVYSQTITIDHTCTDITKIPASWITQVKSMLKIHYAHTSHGEQIMVGLERLSNADSKYSYYPDNCTMPDTTDFLSLMDGQYYDGYCETYVTPGLYWESDLGLNMTRSVLNTFDANISLWAWCSQLDYYTESEVRQYLDAMAQLESEYPNITFIYMTGNAQGSEQNRYDRNNQIRAYCLQNNKVLFDFADLDCWYNGEQNIVGGIPMEHPHYNGDVVAHTTYESCENKGRAFWWLLARMAGWAGVDSGPVPDIRANGSNGPLSVTSGTPVSITVSLDPGSYIAQNADWWIAVGTPFGWFSYVFPTGWMAGINLCIQTPLFNLSPALEVLNIGLGSGDYTFYFAADNNADGIADATWFDYVTVNVQ